jgi:hypothetical protein
MSKKTREERKAGQELTLHHRKPTSIGGSKRDKRNHSYVQHIKHCAWHTLFSNHSAQTIAYIINEKFLDPDYEFICQRKEKK